MPNISSFCPTHGSLLFSLWPHFIRTSVINKRFHQKRMHEQLADRDIHSLEK